MLKIIIGQILAVIYAVASAKHDAPAILKFRNSGVSSPEMAVFHRYNNWMKAAICVLESCAFSPFWKDAIFAGLSSFLWIYLLFDIVVNKNTGMKWDYIGSNDADGRRWIRIFNGAAGKWKAVILVMLIAIINVIKILL